MVAAMLHRTLPISLALLALSACEPDPQPAPPRARDATPSPDAPPPDAPEIDAPDVDATLWPHVDPFVIAPSPTAILARPGTTVAVHVELAREPGFDRTITLDVAGLPAGLEAPRVHVAAGVGSAVVPITVPAGAQRIGPRPFALSASADGVRQSHRLTIEVTP